MMESIENAVAMAEEIAQDESHGYENSSGNEAR